LARPTVVIWRLLTSVDASNNFGGLPGKSIRQIEIEQTPVLALGAQLADCTEA